MQRATMFSAPKYRLAQTLRADAEDQDRSNTHSVSHGKDHQQNANNEAWQMCARQDADLAPCADQCGNE